MLQEKAPARNEIQQQHIRNIKKEIYENISQVLCLARIQLANADPGNMDTTAETLRQTGILIGNAIRDLRNLAKQVNKL